MIVLGERGLDRQLIPDEQCQRFELDMSVAFKPPDRRC